MTDKRFPSRNYDLKRQNQVMGIFSSTTMNRWEARFVFERLRWSGDIQPQQDETPSPTIVHLVGLPPISDPPPETLDPLTIENELPPIPLQDVEMTVEEEEVFQQICDRNFAYLEWICGDGFFKTIEERRARSKSCKFTVQGLRSKCCNWGIL